MHTRRLGDAGPRVGAIGFGAMVLTGLYGAVDADQGLATMRTRSTPG